MGTSHGHDGDALGGEVPAPTYRQRLDGRLVAQPFHEHHRRRTEEVALGFDHAAAAGRWMGMVAPVRRVLEGAERRAGSRRFAADVTGLPAVDDPGPGWHAVRSCVGRSLAGDGQAVGAMVHSTC